MANLFSMAIYSVGLDSYQKSTLTNHTYRISNLNFRSYAKSILEQYA